ncbi:bifunctional uridylate/adenylate kinase [Vanrija albida]|uniref:Uridylate kinase n=1 Tax=Vanrija albida TaxID=181172 RepID=A0ABR3PYL5_9TREE
MPAAFDPKLITVVFVLGGPGVGKGTQSALLVEDYGFKHLSAGDLLRAEQAREGSKYGELIRNNIKEGLIVPMEVTLKLVEQAINEALAAPPSFPEGSRLSAGWQNGKGRFLIDGFPRQMDQALAFDEQVVPSAFVLYFAATEDVMVTRVMHRALTSGRADDNEESLKKRFRTFKETSFPVIEYYEQKKHVEVIDGKPSIPEVYADVKAAIVKRLGPDF